jgi:hypothetical protein
MHLNDGSKGLVDTLGLENGVDWKRCLIAFACMLILGPVGTFLFGLCTWKHSFDPLENSLVVCTPRGLDHQRGDYKLGIDLSAQRFNNK